MGKIEYYIIFRWMREELYLAGAELECYAVIYSLSLGDNWYMAGVKNLVELLEKSEPTIISALKNLTDKGLIVKKPVVINNTKRNYYKAKKNFDEKDTTLNDLSTPTLNDLSTPTLNDLSGINKINNKEIKEEKKNILSNDNKKSDSFDIFWKKYHKGSKKNAFKSWGKLKEQQREEALNNVDSYLLYCKRSNRPLKDVSTYLNGECFNDDWLAVPECYRFSDYDEERVRRFKRYMVTNFPDLIYHRNPLTFEQGDKLMEDYGVAPFEEAMRKLCGRDIHQYYSIKCGVEAILKEIQDDDI